MAKGTSYHLTVRRPGKGKQGELLYSETFNFTDVGRALLRSRLESKVVEAKGDVIARASRDAWPYSDIQWYGVKWKGEVRFISRRQMSASDRLLLDVAMGRINEDEYYDAQAELHG